MMDTCRASLQQAGGASRRLHAAKQSSREGGRALRPRAGERRERSSYKGEAEDGHLALSLEKTELPRCSSSTSSSLTSSTRLM